MHLIELIEIQKIISINIQIHELNFNKNRFIDIGAVSIEGWSKRRDGIITGVILSKKFSVGVHCHNLSFNDALDNAVLINNKIRDFQSMEIVLEKLKEFVGENILLGYNIEKTCGILNSLGKPFGILFKNKLLDTLAIAKSIYKDKIKSYSLLELAQRHGVFRDTFCALDNACITAHLLGELALRDDEAHCNY